MDSSSKTTARYGTLAAVVVSLFLLQAGCTATPIPLPFGLDGAYYPDDFGGSSDSNAAKDAGFDLSYPDSAPAVDGTAADMSAPDGIVDSWTGDAEAGPPTDALNTDALNTDALTDLSVEDATAVD